ncbi:hypothetical protein GCM10010505_74620 [Kitasatospora aburaviensis]
MAGPVGWAGAVAVAPVVAAAGDDADDEPLLQPATTDAVSTATAARTAVLTPKALGPVGLGPAGIGRVGSFLRFTLAPSESLHRDLCQHFTEMSECRAPTRPATFPAGTGP